MKHERAHGVIGTTFGLESSKKGYNVGLPNSSEETIYQGGERHASLQEKIALRGETYNRILTSEEDFGRGGRNTSGPPSGDPKKKQGLAGLPPSKGREPEGGGGSYALPQGRGSRIFAGHCSD